MGSVELLWPGDPVELGPFRLVARLGSGGMGAVFLGQDTGGRAVAVPGDRGQSVVLVIVIDLDVPDGIREEDIATIIGTLRPGGLAQQCYPGVPGGSWC